MTMTRRYANGALFGLEVCGPNTGCGSPSSFRSNATTTINFGVLAWATLSYLKLVITKLGQ